MPKINDEVWNRYLQERLAEQDRRIEAEERQRKIEQRRWMALGYFLATWNDHRLN